MTSPESELARLDFADNPKEALSRLKARKPRATSRSNAVWPCMVPLPAVNAAQVLFDSLSVLGQECPWMDGLDVRIASKVTLVEGKYSLDTVDAHGRSQSRVVDLHARYIMAHN